MALDNTLIQLKQIRKIYGKGQATVHALRNIDLTVKQGEFVAVTGASGSGKSTCMNIIGCLDTPTDGGYFFQDVNVGSISRDQRALLRRYYLGFVFQGYNLLSRTSALENVELPLIYRGMHARQRHQLALESLASVGLSQWAKHTPSELSGGQQQRVAIARAIITEPLLLLADEPTGNLDTVTSYEIMQLLTRLNQEKNITIIMVTHEEDIAAFAQRQIHFKDGKIISDSPSLERATHVD